MDRGAGSNEDFSCLNTEQQSSGYSAIYRRDTEVYKDTVEFMGGICRDILNQNTVEQEGYRGISRYSGIYRRDTEVYKYRIQWNRRDTEVYQYTVEFMGGICRGI